MNNDSGFTMIELLITVAIVAVLMLVVPNFHQLLHNHRQQSSLQSLQQDLQYARALAIHEGKTITLCGAPDGIHCAKQWLPARVIIFSDANNNRLWDKEETLYRDHVIAPSDTAYMEWRGSNSPHISYTASGYPLQWGSYTYCPNNGDPRTIKQLILNRMGRSYLHTPSAKTIRDKNLCSRL